MRFKACFARHAPFKTVFKYQGLRVTRARTVALEMPSHSSFARLSRSLLDPTPLGNDEEF